MKTICVYCGSSPGRDARFVQAAKATGEEIARRQLTLIYGGGRVGLMGEVARAALSHGGRVIGVIPKALVEQELAMQALSEMHVVASMHERKALMAELADGFIALPGGFGTIEEIFEVLTWAQLGMHTKPCGLLNTAHYFDQLLQFIDQAVEEHFVHPPHRALILQGQSPAELLDLFLKHKPVRMDKAEWVRKMSDAANGED